MLCCDTVYLSAVTASHMMVHHHICAVAIKQRLEFVCALESKILLPIFHYIELHNVSVY